MLTYADVRAARSPPHAPAVEDVLLYCLFERMCFVCSALLFISTPHRSTEVALPQEELLDEIDHVEAAVIAGMRSKSLFKDLLFKYLLLTL